MQRLRVFLLSALASTVVTVAQAAAPHVHGHATLEVAVDGNTLTLLFTSPLDSLTGFEHAPRTEKQQDIVRRMAQTLRQAEQVFGLPADAQCGAPRIELASPALPARLLAADATAAGLAEKPAAARAGEHAELDAQYVWSCQRIERLKTIDVKLFASFRNLKRIDARVVAGSQQRSARLTEKMSRLVW